MSKIGIEESYISASNTTTLEVDPERRMPADMLIAAGWNKSRLGTALLRLHSEWDGAEKPRKPIPDLVVSIMERRQITLTAATQLAETWYIEEMKMLLRKLKSLPRVREQLELKALQRGVEEPETLVAGVIHWWLDPTCRSCHGQRWLAIDNTPVLSNRSCPACKSTGKSELPSGDEGRWMLDYIQACMREARSGMAGRFRHQRMDGA